MWSNYLEKQPLYRYFNIGIDGNLFKNNISQLVFNDTSEESNLENYDEQNHLKKNLAELVKPILADEIFLAQQ